MTKKMAIASIILIMILAVGGGIWYLMPKGFSQETKTLKVETKQWKTYVSKYGFSVSYPANWYLQEDKDPKGRREGYWPFAIYDYNPDKPEDYPESKGIGVEFLFYDNVLSEYLPKEMKIPENPYERILLLSDRYNIYKNNPKDTIRKININGIYMVLIYYEGKYPWQIMFYLPNNDAIAIVAISTEKSSSELIPIIKTIKMRK
jgi:hypothetical protein